MTSLLTSLVAKMDSAFGNGKQLGEKAHVEYLSKDLEELFVQYYFQLVRTKDHRLLKFTYLVENIPKNHKLFHIFIS